MLRGVAVGLVLLRHSAPDVFGGAGIVGVTIFFALSGYLITGVLIRDVGWSGRVDYRTFYRNRAVRLLPALGLLLLTFAVVTAVWDPLDQRDRLLPTLAIAATYTADLPLPFDMHSGTTHLWTLAVEEQFYLLWPAVLAFGIRRGRPQAVTIVLLVGSVLLSAVAAFTFRSQLGGLYELPIAWVSALLIGALARLCQEKLMAWAHSSYAAPVATAAGVILLAFSFIPDAKDLVATYVVGAPLVAACTVGLIGWSSTWPTSPPLTSGLRWLGTVSYGAYLWNYLLVAWVTGADGRLLWWQAAATVPLTVAAACVSWFLVERPANLRWRSSAPPAKALVTTT